MATHPGTQNTIDTLPYSFIRLKTNVSSELCSFWILENTVLAFPKLHRLSDSLACSHNTPISFHITSPPAPLALLPPSHKEIVLALGKTPGNLGCPPKDRGLLISAKTPGLEIRVTGLRNQETDIWGCHSINHSFFKSLCCFSSSEKSASSCSNPS